MQQTENLKLNLIETGDPISPVPLNENMDKIEAALRTKTGAAETAVLTQRVVELEKLHFACGAYTGDGANNRLISLGFAPDIVIVNGGVSKQTTLVKGAVSSGSSVVLTEDGFLHIDGSYGSYNQSSYVYTYLALGRDE